MSLDAVQNLIEQAKSLSPEDLRLLIESLNHTQTNDLGSSEKDESDSAKARVPMSKESSERNLNWLKQHRNEYSGKYVALLDGELISFGKTIKEAREKSIDLGVHRPMLVFVLGENEIAFGGW
jgi:hypothetical protein